MRGQGSGLTGDRDYYDNSGNDQAFINFDLKADLSPLFNWNVKVTTSMTREEKLLKVIDITGAVSLPDSRVHHRDQCPQ